jgi:hypothetical protein
MNSLGKHATRYLIPLELFAYAHILVLAFSGGIGQGLLHEVLDKEHDAAIWMVVLGLVGAVGFLVALTEWLFGHEWGDDQLRHWLAWRKWGAALGMVVSSYAIFTMLSVVGGWRVAAIPWMGGINMAFLAWSWWVNYRAEVLLNPALPTSNLENTLASRRGAHW